MKFTHLAPKHANTFNKVCRLQRDNFPASCDEWTILVTENDISLFPPRGEKIVKDYITIPKTAFNKIINWYDRPQKLHKD